MARGVTATKAFRRLASSGRCGGLSRGVARPARLALAGASHGSSPLMAPISTIPTTAHTTASPLHCRTDVASRRSLFSLAAAAAAVGQAANGSGGPQQTLTTARTLPYTAGDLFHIIADVDAYAQFLPHCTSSRVTHWRAAKTTKTKTAQEAGQAPTPPPPPSLPARADLTVGWGPLSQSYSSRVYCVPGHGVVEAVSGRAGAPTLTAAERAEIGLSKAEDEDGRRLGAQTASDDDTFESLVTRWMVVSLDESASAPGDCSPATASRPPRVPRAPQTRVELHIRFQFRSPLFQMAAAQVGNEMATKMIDAFEARAAALLGR